MQGVQQFYPVNFEWSMFIICFVCSPESVIKRFQERDDAVDSRGVAEFLRALVLTNSLSEFLPDEDSGKPSRLPTLFEKLKHRISGKDDEPVLNPGASERQPLHVVMVDPDVPNRSRFAQELFAATIVFTVAVGVVCFGGVGNSGVSSSNSYAPKEVNKDVMTEKELEEVVEYLKNPAKFTRLGGKLPKGILLTGPPGTGKTSLAKAIAGEAGVPFFYREGSEFEEMFVGVGARCVRSLFQSVKKKGIIVIAVTNLPDILDSALTRPGRFDQHIVVPNPDLRGRQVIFELYLQDKPLVDDVDVKSIALGTPGFNGADLANLVNIAAIKAAVEGAEKVSASQLEFAKERITMGTERKTMFLSEKSKKHDGGNLVAVNEMKLVESLSYLASCYSKELEWSLNFPLVIVTSISKQQLLACLDVCMGGRVAEELIFGQDHITTVASSDLHTAIELAQYMRNHGEVDSISDCQLNHSEVDFEFESNEVPESLSVVDEQLVPKVGMTFKNLEDAAKFYKDYAKTAGLLYPVKPLSCCISGASKFQPISRTCYELSVQGTSSSG
ncbi:ATP-dependent zinc metalloprotease FTSH 11/mitochondrial [Arachis hypogaea]|nr:ATP-dependent zinc metalloprotease FTSH 11/mitochondrial [Arachis hypogaea]